METRDRVDEVFGAISVEVTARPGNGRYGYSDWVRSGVRYSATFSRGKYEFGADFSKPEGLQLASRLDRTLRTLGMERRDQKPREDLNAYGWLIEPDADGTVDGELLRNAKRALDAVLRN